MSREDASKNGVITSDNSTLCASTAYVKANLANYLPLSGGMMTGNLNMGGCQIVNANSIELITSAGANYGGFIDFHFNGSTEDYTSRIIEDANSCISIHATNGCRINGSNVVRSVNGVGAGTDGNVSLFTYGTNDLNAGSSSLANGHLYFVYE